MLCRTVKHTWLELGNQLGLLATLHAEKAKLYLNEARQPLLDLAPVLEETRKEVQWSLHNQYPELGNQLSLLAMLHAKLYLSFMSFKTGVGKMLFSLLGTCLVQIS